MNNSKTSACVADILLIQRTVPIRALWLIIKGFDDHETVKAPVC